MRHTSRDRRNRIRKQKAKNKLQQRAKQLKKQRRARKGAAALPKHQPEAR